MGYACVFGFAALLTVLPGAARADDACGPLKIVNIVHMIPSLTGEADFVPVAIAGKSHIFLLDTGGYYSQISRPLAEALKLSIRQSGRQLYDAAGNVSRDQVTVPALKMGEVTTQDVDMMISSTLSTAAAGPEGVIAPDLFDKDDAELDFSTDTLNLFSPDHCPGHVVYWSAPAVAQVPFTMAQSAAPPPVTLGGRAPLARQPGNHIVVSVMLDGQKLDALLDTGATNTSLRRDIAERLYHLTMGSADTPLKGTLNGVDSLKTYSHLFSNLSFGAVTVSNARMTIIPNVIGRDIEPLPLAADRALTERDLVREPELILGMDVLRRLRIYFAFHERVMYVSPSSAAPVGTVQPYSAEFLAAMLKGLDGEIATSPDDPAALNDRCYWRAIAKTELDDALADCDKSLKFAPNVAVTLDSRAFVLYQQGKYQDALAAYDAALAADAKQAPSLWMRGLTKEKLGDETGKDADTATAKADDPNIEAEFKRIGITP